MRRPTSPIELQRALPTSFERGLIARGLGRSYGDAAQNAGPRVWRLALHLQQVETNTYFHAPYA